MIPLKQFCYIGNSMRRTRPLLLLAIFAVLVVVGISYQLQKGLQQSQSPPIPKSLPPDTSAAAEQWTWSKSEGSRTVIEVRAGNFRQVKDPSRLDLEKVELRLYGKDGKTYDLVRSARAEFDVQRGLLYSDGQVEFTMGVAADGSSAGRLIFIRSSGVTFEASTGRASTDRLAMFSFDRGEGSAVGATYDPTIRELHMRSQAEVTWRGEDPDAKPMKVEAGELLYKERDSVVILYPWSRLTREDMKLQAGHAIVSLEGGAIRRVEAKTAHGSATHGDKRLEYAAEQIVIHFSEATEVQKIEGERNARLASISEASRTTVTADRLDLEFDLASGESQLRRAWARGRCAIESRPVPSKDAAAPETRILRSEVVELDMAAGGREIESVSTHAPGSVEFLPGVPGRKHRKLDAERISIAYGARNQIRSFRASNVSTRTESPQPQGRKPAPAVLTWSKDLKADFDPERGQLVRIEQWNDFRYEEGDRKGSAERAALDASRNLISLQGAARLWDPAGVVSADQILLNQENGDVTGEGNVTSNRAVDRKSGSTVISADEPLHAKADRMTSAHNNRVIRYERGAILWQEGNRIEGDWVEINREKQQLTARGNVVTQFVEKPQEDAARVQKNRSPGFTIIHAAELLYRDETRVAHYRGGVKMIRSGTEVKAAELRAHLEEKDSGTRLEKAYADGRVEILRSSPDRTRKALAEHAEYYASDDKIVLYGGEPLLFDSRRGSTRGQQLTWFPNNDRLLVDGREDQRAVSRILRK